MRRAVDNHGFCENDKRRTAAVCRQREGSIPHNAALRHREISRRPEAAVLERPGLAVTRPVSIEFGDEVNQSNRLYDENETIVYMASVGRTR